MGAPQHISLEGITPGMDFGPVVFGPLSREDFVRYAEASGDDNPIHQDEEYARSQGAPTVFAMGMLAAGYLAHAVADWFGGPQHVARYKVRFTTRMWPGDEIICTGKVESLEGSRVTVSLEALRHGDGPEGLNLDEEQVALIGEAEVDLPE